MVKINKIDFLFNYSRVRMPELVLFIYIFLYIYFLCIFIEHFYVCVFLHYVQLFRKCFLSALHKMYKESFCSMFFFVAKTVKWGSMTMAMFLLWTGRVDYHSDRAFFASSQRICHSSNVLQRLKATLTQLAQSTTVWKEFIPYLLLP